MAAPAVDPLHAICFSSGSVGQATDDESPAKKSIDCRCGMLCRLASTDMPAIVGGEDPVAFAALEVAIGAAILFEEVASLPLRRLIAEPRAPPLFS
ncbi:hypothetical protein [Rhizobium sp. 007]|uniref:hypothetical protein n=1 Tax=Rhizobium sp. 007 TaxID=2785056 RepID=UPI001FEF8D07|nr:hypothetical protein [Rhizobium sp. 007]